MATSRDEITFAAGDMIGRLTGRHSALQLPLSRLDADLVAQIARACLSTADDEVVARKR